MYSYQVHKYKLNSIKQGGSLKFFFFGAEYIGSIIKILIFT